MNLDLCRITDFYGNTAHQWNEKERHNLSKAQHGILTPGSGRIMYLCTNAHVHIQYNHQCFCDSLTFPFIQLSKATCMSSNDPILYFVRH